MQRTGGLSRQLECCQARNCGSRSRKNKRRSHRRDKEVAKHMRCLGDRCRRRRLYLCLCNGFARQNEPSLPTEDLQEYGNALAAFEQLFKNRFETRERPLIDTHRIPRFDVYGIDLGYPVRTALAQCLNDIFTDLGNASAESEKILYSRRITRSFAGDNHVETAKNITRQPRCQNPVESAADPPPHAHPRQEYLQTEISEPPLDVPLAIHLGSQRIPSQPCFNLQWFRSHTIGSPNSPARSLQVMILDNPSRPADA